MSYRRASFVITLSVSISLFGVHFGFAESNLKPIVKKSPLTPATKTHISSTPSKSKPRLTPTQPKTIRKQTTPIVSAPDPNCYNNLYGGLKKTYGELSQLCAYSQYPSTQHYTTLRERIDFFYFNWNVSDCPTLVPEAVDRDFKHITFTKVPFSAARCGDKCFSKLSDEEDVRAILGKCNSCCLFLPEAKRAQCASDCADLVRPDQVPHDELVGGAESAKEQFRDILQKLRDAAQRQSENTGVVTNP